MLESQKITKLPIGSLEITFRVAGLDEIKRWVLSFGPDAIVLEPEKLRMMVRENLLETLGQYRATRMISRVAYPHVKLVKNAKVFS